MKKLKIAFALFLMLAMTVSLVALPTAYAWDDATTAAVNAGMKWDFPGAENYNASATRLLLWQRYKDKIPTVVYGVLSPNPVGVGQQMTMLLFNPVAPPGSLDPGNEVRWEYSVAITDPDGQTERLPATGTITSDATGTAYTTYTPRKVGNYSVTIKFHELFYRWYEGPGYNLNLRDYYGVTFLESTEKYTLVVQEEQVVPTAITSYPLPTEYWTRPIEGQNNAWGQISSNWLNNAKDRDYGSWNNRFQTEGVAPNSAHILWTKPTEDGGVVGGDKYFSSPGEVFNTGSNPYIPRFQTQIIMQGRLYYEVPIAFAGGGGGWMCVDLRTGEEIWGPRVFPVNPSFGYYYDLDTINQHGIVNPGWIFAVSGANWYSVHPLYGAYGQVNVTNVPIPTHSYSAYEVIGPKGEILRYVIQNAGTTANPDWRLLQWNFSKVWPTNLDAMTPTNLGTFNGGTSSAYDWNVSLPIANGLTGSKVIVAAMYNDVLLCYNGTMNWISLDYADGGFYHNPETATLWAVSLKPESRGQTVFGPTNYQMTTADGTWKGLVRAGDGVFIMVDMPSYAWEAYSMHTGQKLWESDPETEVNPLGYYSYMYASRFLTGIAYGKFFSTGYAGHVFCYDLYNGTLLWTYAAPTNALVFDYYTIPKYAIADGKLFLGAYEHTPDTPLYKGNRVRCLNVTTGEEIWSMLGYPTQYSIAIADGVLVHWNQYDHQVYAVGKGPSATTVSIQNDVTTHGNKVLVKGSVIDISAGTKQDEQAARFPYGVPAVSDASMGEWMEYVYMQKPKPTNVTGVEVIVSVLDPNNNCHEVGRTTGDADGFFSCDFVPEVPGKYTVVATFAGSESYWPSHAETALFVEEAPAATPEPTPTPASIADLYLVPGIIGIIIAIAVVGAIIVMMLRKR